MLRGHCSLCMDEGEIGGCPKCGLWPMPPEKEINGEVYTFFRNVERKKKDLYEDQDEYIILDDARSIYNDPLPNDVSVWRKKKF